jgi:hypothetical protein
MLAYSDSERSSIASEMFRAPSRPSLSCGILKMASEG